MPPWRELLASSSNCRLLRSPNSGGMPPVKPFSGRISPSSSPSRPSCGGMAPAKPLDVRSRTWSVEMLPRNGVSAPRSRDSRSWMDVTRPAPSQAMPVRLQCRGTPPRTSASPRSAAPTVQLDSAPSGSAVTPFLNASSASSCTCTEPSTTAAGAGAADNNDDATNTARTGSSAEV